MSGRWIVALAVVAVAGCGSEPGLSAGTSAAMHKDVADARAAQQAGDPGAAVAALQDLERRIDAAERDGQISGGTAAALNRGAARARRRAEREIAPPQPEATSTPIPTPVPTVAPPGPGKGKGKEKGHHKDEGDEG